MKIRLILGVLGPSGRDLAQGEFSFFSFAMILCTQEFVPASFLIELSSVLWGHRHRCGSGRLVDEVPVRT